MSLKLPKTPPAAALQVQFKSQSLWLFPASLTSLLCIAVYRTYCNAWHSLGISLPPPCLPKITRYSFTVVSICHPLPFPSTSLDMQGQTVATQKPVVYVHNFHHSLILFISLNPFEMVAMNLHCIRWCGKRPSPKWLLMIMPHCKECEHSMEMVQQAWRTGEGRCRVEDWEVLKIGWEGMQSAHSPRVHFLRGIIMCYFWINRSMACMWNLRLQTY